MTRIQKVNALKERKCNIHFHYMEGKNYKRLIIDSIEGFHYNTTSKDQVLAGLEIDTLYMEVVENDD